MMTQEAIDQIWEAGRNREPFAMTIMAVWLYEGNFIQRDAEKALAILQNMSDAKVLWARDILLFTKATVRSDSNITQHAIVSSEALEQMKEYAERGSMYAMVALGLLLYLGYSVPQNKDEGIRYLSKSAQGGCLWAQYLLETYGMGNSSFSSDGMGSVFDKMRQNSTNKYAKYKYNPLSGSPVVEEADQNKKQQQENVVVPHDYMNELDNLIGLNDVKEDIRSLRNFVMIQQRRQQNGQRPIKVSYHCVFSGNPGTGKTTVARIVAGIYKELGILEKGQLIEVQRSDLVAEYVGQTAVKTNKKIDEALDGVLFIDEAYTLSSGGANDFGQEAINTLLKRMEDDRDRLVVILAGYSDEIKQFINSNPGLESRFNRYIHFPDYSVSELMDIFSFNLRKAQYTITSDARTVVNSLVEQAVANKDSHFGNARYVRNLFEKILQKQADRLAAMPDVTKEQLSIIEAADVEVQV